MAVTEQEGRSSRPAFLSGINASMLKVWVGSAPKFDGMMTEGQVTRVIKSQEQNLRIALEGLGQVALQGVPRGDTRGMPLAETFDRLFRFGAYTALVGVINVAASSRASDMGENYSAARMRTEQVALSTLDSSDAIEVTKAIIAGVVNDRQAYMGGKEAIFNTKDGRQSQTDIPITYLRILLGGLRAQVEAVAPELSPLFELSVIYVNPDYPDLVNTNFPYAQTAQGQNEILNTVARIGVASALLLLINTSQKTEVQ